jgi:nanoRNase/pAp phosphatase (c-di-AMP/oligoRNAs hydrolase)
MENMIQYCRTKTAEEILAIPDVEERTLRYHKQEVVFKEMLARNHEVHDNVVVINLLDEDTIYSGNRFLVYALFPLQNIEIRVMWGKDKQNVVFACGHSILNRTSKTNVGKLMLEHGGGGHPKVGTCQVPVEDWERVLGELVERMTSDG